ncbi:nicotinate phosphoribosyltransferase [Hydrogenispora ethanolica]|uniref:Nicotinate phosphoribosyltransferase n=1 Tax=Hydrogenispora ethanolica TaxID=1082276 RepID=A0A4V2QDQ6_HYDET|nr:nicotinate phosphoribosyltransferase [Hydrogenispora ethanolica]TCL64777.1 nicotinate phosphoribosyltransferase [Hydrogenispora ethanolica]
MENLSDTAAGWGERRDSALLTDYYEITMLYGFWKYGRHEQQACFEYFFRSLPPHNGFALSAGLEQFLDFLRHFAFNPSDLAYLGQQGFEPEFLEYLAHFKPDFDLWAVPEGSVVFPNEPLIRVEGPLGFLQLLETILLNSLNYPTLVATKAARVCYAAEGDPVMEFGLRRAQGPDGGLSGARAAIIGGCVGTSNVLAGKLYGAKILGTHAHSWVMSFESETEAFRAYAKAFPNNITLLVDTYDPVNSGIPNAITVFRELRAQGLNPRGSIRLDSGDLAKLSKEAWRLFREAGFENPSIVASNELDEDLIADLKRQGAKINSWGVGTNLITSRDYPALGGVYKLVAIHEAGGWEPRIKISGNITKITDPGRKRIIRYYDHENHPLADLLYLEGEPVQQGRVKAYDRENLQKEITFRADHYTELSQKMAEGGKFTVAPVSLPELQARAQANLTCFPDEYRRLRYPQTYDVFLSPEAARVKHTLLEANGFYRTEAAGKEE